MNIHNTAFQNMFREYDVRGEVNEEQLNAESVYHISSAYAEYIKKRGIFKAVVGYDNRDCSIEFANAAIRALTDRGIDVVYIGLSLSPVTYFAQYLYQCEGAIMVTASHNPNGWSGFKFANGYSRTLEPDDIKELYGYVENLPAVSPEARKGTVTDQNAREDYINEIISRIHMGSKPLRVVIDAGNGGAGLFAYELFQRLGCMTFQLNCDPDTTYPHYFPNPSNVAARDRLRAMVTHPYIQADIGIGFDGDGDRIGIIDENGNDIWSDVVLAVLAKHLLERERGKQIVFDVKCSKTLEEVIVAGGGIPVMWKTGHSYIKSKMHEINAALAGERSGHIFYGGEDYYGFDDALFTAAKMLEFLSNQDKTVSEIVDEFPRYVTSPEIKALCGDSVKYGIIDSIVDELKQRYGDRVNDICGARVTYDYGWGLVRASSNLPEIVLIFEADTTEHMLSIRSEFKELLSKYKDIDPNWHNDVKLP